MAKPSLRGGGHVAARPTPPTLERPLSETKAETTPPDTPASGKLYYVVVLVWAGGFLALTLLLFAESLPLLWDLIRLRF